MIYIYQYNVKIIGLPEQEMHEAAVETTKFCVKLFSIIGVNVSEVDVDT